MGWDIGARGASEDLAAVHNIARVCAWWTLAAGAVVIVVRYLALRASLVPAHWGSAVARRLHGLAGCFLSACRRDLGPGRGDCHCDFTFDARGGQTGVKVQRENDVDLHWRCSSIAAGSFAAEQTSPQANSEAGSDARRAKTNNGKPIITPEQRTYFDGLNDNLRELLSRQCEKEIITRAEHLAMLLELQLRPQKMELVLQNNCILCHTDSANQSAGDSLYSRIRPRLHRPRT